MKKVKILIITIICNTILVHSQVFKIEKNKILESDIYSNFSDDNYKIQNAEISSELKILLNKTFNLQDTSYLEKIKIAEKFYKNKNYKAASNFFLKAITENNNSGRISDRIKLACCFSILSEEDSAFVQLFRIARQGKYTNLIEIENEKELTSLHNTIEWSEFLRIINENRNIELKKLNDQIKLQE